MKKLWSRLKGSRHQLPQASSRVHTSASGSVTLSDLPNEILDHILSFVQRADLSSLSLVNNYFHQSTEPLLYSTIILNRDYWHTPPIIPLLRTLLERPELSSYIDTVSMHGSYFGRRAPQPLDTTKIPYGQFIDAIEKTQVPYTGLWIERLSSGSTCMDALASLFVAGLSKTSRLAIHHNFINGQEVIGKVLQSKIFRQGQLPAFEKLSHVRYTKSIDREDWNNNLIFTDAMSLFYLPTVTHIVASISNPEIFRWPAEKEPNLGHLVSLDIEWICEPFLAKILALTRNLKSLFWTWIYHDIDDDSEPPILDFDKIVGVLSHVRSTLERLNFRLDIGGGEEVLVDLGVSVLGSLNGLRDFNRITHLDIPLVCLTGFGSEPLPLERSIPDSVENLFLSGQMLYDDGIPAQWPCKEPWRDWKMNELYIELVRPLAQNYPMRLAGLRRVIIVDGSTSVPNLKLEVMAEKLAFGFDVQVIPEQLPIHRYCFGWESKGH